MGIGVSKSDSNPLVTLCKERKELIRAARDARYCLATAHALYFRSLVSFGNALNQFVEKELKVIPFSSDDDDSSTENSDSDSDSKDSNFTSDSSSFRFCNQSQVSDCREHSGGGCGKRQSLNTNLRNTESASVCDQHRFVPVSIVGEDQQNNRSNGHTCMRSNDSEDKGKFNSPEGIKDPKDGSGFDENEFVSVSMEMPSHSPFTEESDTLEISPSRSPPEPSVPVWDFLNVFSAADYAYCDYYNAERDEAEGYQWREVREREGIPDLEDESKQTPVEEPSQGSKHKRKVRKDSSNGTVAREVPSKINSGQVLESGDSGVAASKIDKAGGKTDEKEMKNDPVSCEQEAGGNSETSTLSTSEDTDLSVRKSFDLVIVEDGSSGSTSSSMHTSGTKDIRTVVKQIKDISETTISKGKKVSALLEVGRLPHQPLGAKFKGFALRVLSSRHLTHKHLSHLDPTLESIQGIGLSLKSGYLSSTLEKLYIWEKKLFEEVMMEEKLRVLYDKEYKTLMNLDRKGAEPSRIEAVEASVKLLLSKTSVSVKAVDAISRRIHKIRDEELVFQLFEIIHGLAEMWRFFGKCHHKQFWKVTGSKSSVHLIEPNSQKSSSLKATQKLTSEILKYEASFKNYVASQKAFVRLLNEWLTRGILNNDEPDETPKDKTAYFSPTKIGAPEVFTACNDWWHEIGKVAETKVCKAIQELASRFRALESTQTQEEQQRNKTKQTEKELAKQTRNFHERWGMATSMSDSIENKMVTDVGGADEELLSLRKVMAAEKAKHEKAVRQVNDTVSACLQESLAPVFEALEDFCVENVKAYQNIRLPWMV